ncbi:hypothetical protein [Streptomyces noursei]|nr:hypothetical protein [Streptomyces noursei]
MPGRTDSSAATDRPDTAAPAHGSTLTATGSPLGGARFTLRLPTHNK